MFVKGSSSVSKPLTKSGLSKKGLCDYVVNIAVGCLHSCKFCYVPSTPIIRMQSNKLKELGVEEPSKDWGSYLFFYRGNIVSALKSQLNSKSKWLQTDSGKGIVMMCSTTDPYQNKETSLLSK